MDNTDRINKKTARYPGLDAMKCICAFLVVMIHVNASGGYLLNANGVSVPGAISAFARAGVPFFFMVTGFFFESLYERGRLKGYCRKIVLYLLSGVCAYTVLTILLNTTGNDAFTHISRFYTFSDLKNIIAFPTIGSHLWYLTSLLEAIPLLWLMRKFLPLQYVYAIGLGLLAASFFMTDTQDSWHYRNAVFLGLPYLILGMFLKNSDNLMTVLSKRKVLTSLIILSLLAFGVELFMLDSFSARINRDHYFSTPLLALALFCIGFFMPGGRLSVLSVLGRDYSTHVYIWHMALIYLLIPHFKDKMHYLVFGGIVFALSLAVIWISYKIKNCFRAAYAVRFINIKTGNK